MKAVFTKKYEEPSSIGDLFIGYPDDHHDKKMNLLHIEPIHEMRYIEFLTSSKERQDRINTSIRSMEKEHGLKIRINNLIGQSVYIKVKRPKKGVPGLDDHRIEEMVLDILTIPDMDIRIWIEGV